MLFHSRLVFLGVLLAWPLCSSPLRAVAPVVHDEGKFFTPETVKKLNDIAHDLAGKTGRDLLIETFPTVPAEQAARVKAMSTEEREKYFRQWGEERVKAAYGEQKYGQLVALKNAYDPTNFFRLNQNISPERKAPPLPGR